LPLPTLSNLLWAANGINRAEGGRTAPSAMKAQEVDIYVALPSHEVRKARHEPTSQPGGAANPGVGKAALTH
jgi:hypothetical protein